MKKEENQNRDIVLNYIDKTHISLQAIGKKLNRTIIFLFLVNVLILAIHFGWISVTNSLPILGLVIQVPMNILMFVLCMYSYFLQVYMFGLGVKESENSDLVVNLYKKLGFYDPSLNSEEACVLEYPMVMSVVFSKLMKKKISFVDFLSNFASFFSSIMILIIATVTIGIVSFGVIKTHSFYDWESISMLVLWILSLINLMTGFKKASSL